MHKTSPVHKPVKIGDVLEVELLAERENKTILVGPTLLPTVQSEKELTPASPHESDIAARCATVPARSAQPGVLPTEGIVGPPSNPRDTDGPGRMGIRVGMIFHVIIVNRRTRETNMVYNSNVYPFGRCNYDN
jgi:hypothetical protein